MATGDVKVVGSIDSLFLQKFREKFVTSGKWPRSSTNTPGEWSAEFMDVFRAMFLRIEGSETPDPGPANSAKQLIRELIAETGWPKPEQMPVPDPWKDRPMAFRRYEIVQAMDIMMRVFQPKGLGGDSSGLPPDR
jgi:hypothetical protein